MNMQPKSLRSLEHLLRFEPLTPSKLFYVNQTTSLDLMTELIHRVKQTQQFIMVTKYDNAFYSAVLIQVLFSKQFQTYTILIEVEYLPKDTSILFF